MCMSRALAQPDTLSESGTRPDSSSPGLGEGAGTGSAAGTELRLPPAPPSARLEMQLFPLDHNVFPLMD